MAELILYIKPYEARQAIEKNSDQVTLGNLLQNINNDVAQNLPNVCPKCTWLNPDTSTIEGKGLVPDPTEPGKEIECDVCGGWGATIEPVSKQIFFGTSPQPTVTQP